jgi:hypothetical protein
LWEERGLKVDNQDGVGIEWEKRSGIEKEAEEIRE